ncbi:MAG: glycosyltransferase [Candidatus Aminicenantes bacterium]|nr:glycosyltransferase [Candidatus Aminicenantes bacterium]
MRVALVHDWLTGRRGGEKVLEALAELFPEAPIYTLFHFKGSQAAEIEEKVVRTSFLQRMPFLKRHYRWYLPLYPMAAEMFDLQAYDLVISSSHCVAKGIIPHPDALHVSYVHSPVRYAWNQYWAYFGPGKLGVFSKLLIPPMIHALRQWDVTSAARVDHFVANAGAVARRIEKYYRRPAAVIHPPVDTEFFTLGEAAPARNFDLIVTALVPYKRVDLAVAAYNRNGLPLKIVGDGPDYKALKAAAKPNLEFTGALGGSDLREIYRNARLYLLPGEEDFGISVVEAQACGTPVVAFGRGGATETVLDGVTGLFFKTPNVEGLLGALDKFRGLAFNSRAVREHALLFSGDRFKSRISDFLQAKWRESKEKP